MKYLLWALSFAFLCTAAVTGVLSSIGAIEASWFVVTLISIVSMFSCVEYIECYYKD